MRRVRPAPPAAHWLPSEADATHTSITLIAAPCGHPAAPSWTAWAVARPSAPDVPLPRHRDSGAWGGAGRYRPRAAQHAAALAPPALVERRGAAHPLLPGPMAVFCTHDSVEHVPIAVLRGRHALPVPANGARGRPEPLVPDPVAAG